MPEPQTCDRSIPLWTGVQWIPVDGPKERWEGWCCAGHEALVDYEQKLDEYDRRQMGGGA